MYPEQPGTNSAYDWAVLASNLASQVAGAYSGYPTGYGSYNPAFTYPYNTYNANPYGVSPTLFDTYNNTGLFSGGTGTILLLGLAALVLYAMVK